MDKCPILIPILDKVGKEETNHFFCPFVAMRGLTAPTFIIYLCFHVVEQVLLALCLSKGGPYNSPYTHGEVPGSNY
jgi:hypothetical protein